MVIAQGIPEPSGGKAQNGLYRSVRTNLQDLRRRLHELPPVADKDMDSRRTALLRSVDAALLHLERLRDDAYLETILAKMISQSSSDKGPVLISAGKHHALLHLVGG